MGSFIKNPQPQTLEEICRKACLTEKSYLDYAGDSSIFLYDLIDAVKFNEPRSLPIGVHPPQSFVYWPENVPPVDTVSDNGGVA